MSFPKAANNPHSTSVLVDHDKKRDENLLTIFVSHHIIPDSADAIDDVRMAKMVVKMMKDEALKLL